MRATAFLALLLYACVPQSTHDDLKRQYDEAQARLGDRQNRVASLEQTLAEEQARSAQLTQQIAEAQAKLAELERQLSAAQAEIDRLATEEKRLGSELAKVLKDRSQLKESTAQLREALSALSQRKTAADRRIAEYRHLLAKFKNLIDAGTLQVRIVDGRMVLALPTDVLFDSGSAMLSKEGALAVTEVTQVLKTIGERRFQVEGHTDNVPIRTAQYPSNWELASARALGVVKAMIAAGMSASALSAASYGEFHPVSSNDSAMGRALNRRIEIVLLPDLSMLPGFDELQRVVEHK